MQVNIARLREKILAQGMTQEKAAHAIGMDKSTFSRKMKGQALGFSVGEMHKLVSVLNINNTEAVEIFLFENSQ